jgi:membrane-bound acyltransferase YfiQ involved in biofilm formation
MYKRLLALNGLAILAVAANHATGWGVTAMVWWADRYRPVSVPYNDAVETRAYDATILVQLLATFAIPAFLFVSGVFAAYAAQGAGQRLTWKVVRVRIVGLLIPYGIWSLVVFVKELLQGEAYTLAEYLLRLAVLGAGSGYFFIPVLILFYLISPLLVPWAGRRWKWLLAISALVQLMPMSIRYLGLLPVEIPGLEQLAAWVPDRLIIRWAFFFPLGLVVGLHIEHLGPWLHARRRLLLGAAALAAILYVAEYALLFHAPAGELVISISFCIYSVAVILAFLSLGEDRLPWSRWLTQLGIRSYGIYLIHAMVMEIGARLLYHLAPWILGIPILFQPLLVAMGVGVPLMMMTAVARSPLRWSYRSLFG